jgi:hypothetical protein
MVVNSPGTAKITSCTDDTTMLRQPRSPGAASLAAQEHATHCRLGL